MRLCILETDHPAEALQPRFGSYADMFERWLAGSLPQASFTHVDIVGGAALPAPAAFDGYLITGSRFGVYDPEPWIDPLKAFLRDLRSREIPVAGICFGHQLMAEAFGGKVEKSGAGWILGMQENAVTEAGRALFGEQPTLSALSFHQDQITRLPPAAQVTISSAASPHGGLAYDFPALSVQFHPEFHTDFVGELLNMVSDMRIPKPITDAALATLGPLPEGARVAQTFAGFFDRHTRRG